MEPESTTPDWIEQIDHTADVGIVVKGENLPQLFERAAWGMFSVITDPEAVRPAEERNVSIEADDLPALLHRWLSELNFLHITGHELYSEFTVDAVGHHELRARVRGEKIDLARHTIYTEVKAVTFHGLSIQEENGGWKAQIIFDM